MTLKIKQIVKYLLLLSSFFFLPCQMASAATIDVFKSDSFIFGTVVHIERNGIVKFEFINKTGLTIKDFHLYFTDSKVSFRLEDQGGTEPFVLNNPFTNLSLTGRTLNLWAGQGIAPDQKFTFSTATTVKNVDELFAYQATFNGTELISPVPLPGTVWLFGSSLVGLVGMKNRKNKMFKLASNNT